jgi:tRNA-modifying protein YgfZ
MSGGKIALLVDRSMVIVKGPDAKTFLQGLLTNVIEPISREGLLLQRSTFAGLLSPQGKILFDFFVTCSGEDEYILDVARAQSAELVKRLAMYKLRAKIEILDASESWQVYGRFGDTSSGLSFTMWRENSDPRRSAMGSRILWSGTELRDHASEIEYIYGNTERLNFATPVQFVRSYTDRYSTELPAEVPVDDYHAHRIALGVPEGGKDYDFGDAYPHEANFDLFNGVSFTKGCYVGQEVVARMQNKTVVRKRVVKVQGSGPLTCSAEILLGEAPIGKIGSKDGIHGLAMLRLDRAIEAFDKGIALMAGGVAITADPTALDRYRTSINARPAAPGLSS